MEYLSKFGVGHKKLDSTKVLFSSDGCVKIGQLCHNRTRILIDRLQAHFDECQATESASARSLGFVAIEMMQNGIPPKGDGKFTLQHPDRWSPEAANFLDITSWGTLKDIQKVSTYLIIFKESCLLPSYIEQILEVHIAYSYDPICRIRSLGYY